MKGIKKITPNKPVTDVHWIPILFNLDTCLNKLLMTSAEQFGCAYHLDNSAMSGVEQQSR
jgi:hypothetical protein